VAPKPGFVKVSLDFVFQVKVPLLHLESLFLDEPLWDLSAPRAACEAYVAAICNELGLDWQSHTMIMRRMKDAIDAAAKVRAVDAGLPHHFVSLHQNG
jgi:hypothetical protein